VSNAPRELKASVDVSFGSKGNNLNALSLEQQPWPKTGGILTIDQLALIHGWVVSDHWDELEIEYFSQCAMEKDGSFNTVVYVFTNDPEYELVTSNGTLDPEKQIVTLTREDSPLIELGISLDFPYKVKSLLSATWQGKVWNKSGQVIDPPAVTMTTDNRLIWKEPVYGTIRYSITVEAFAHTLNVTLIPGSVDNKYATNVLAFQKGVVVGLDITEPDNLNGCLGNSSVVIDNKTPKPDPNPDLSNEPVPVVFEFFDYCTGAKITPKTLYVDSDAVTTLGVQPIYLTPGLHRLRVTADGYKDSDADDIENDEFTITVKIIGKSP